MDLLQLRRKTNKKLAELDAARALCKSLDGELGCAKDGIQDAEKAQELAQQVAQTVQQQAHDKIAGVVSRCLDAIFEEPYNFQIHFERKRGRTEARLSFERDGLEVDPMTASGGGIIDVASFALRLSCLMLRKPALRRVMIMDEPFKFVSEEYRDRIRELLETLSKEMKVQFIMVTHIQELKTGSIVEITS